MSKHVGKKGKNCVFPVLLVPKGAKVLQKLTQIVDTRTWSVIQWIKVICKISAQYFKACRRKVQKTVYFQYSKFQKGHYSYIDWCELTTDELDPYYSNTKLYVKFQLNMSKHVMEKYGIVCISSILSSKRGITPRKLTEIDDTQTWSVVQ